MLASDGYERKALSLVTHLMALEVSHTGKIQWHAPPDSTDNAWPHRAVRRVLCELRSDEVDSGFARAVINTRGVTSRPSSEGGEQECVLAGRYKGWADQIRAGTPRAARILDQLAESYRDDGRREDLRVEMQRLRIG